MICQNCGNLIIRESKHANQCIVCEMTHRAPWDFEQPNLFAANFEKAIEGEIETQKEIRHEL